MTGQRLSHFEILDKLGEGGMGVVYKARDTQLERPVAIKLLRSDKVADAERRRRFIQEAKAASALNHPNIVTIHEIGQDNGADFIAMEFIDGRTLDQAIPRKGMRLGDALKYAIQTADALAKAHAAGITHRDLKPSNIMITADERVKILDFGLAKLTEKSAIPAQDEATRTAPGANSPKTVEGSLLGTVAYMSPEQAEGRPLDTRSDVFSFGSVLYEMVSGHRAFQGGSQMATLGAVIHQEPKPLGEVAPAVPRELERLIARCLRKDPARRVQHIVDVKLALEEIREDSESGALQSNSASGSIQVPAAPASGRPSWLVPAAAGIGAAVLGAGWIITNGRKSDPPAAVANPVVLTSYAGVERDPALSPDGKSVAFAWNGEKEDNTDIYVKLVEAGTPLRLTNDPLPESAPAWSPDGNFIAFVRTTPDRSGGYYVVPALGGQARKVADIAPFPSHVNFPSASWTADGKSLAIMDTSVSPAAIALLSVATGEKRILTKPPVGSMADGDPRISPDGKWLAFVRNDGVSAGDWWVRSVDESSPELRRLTQFKAESRGGGSWMPDSREMIVQGMTDGERRIWRVALDGRPPQLVPGMAVGDQSPSIAARGARIAFRRVYVDTNLYSASLTDPTAAPVRVIASSRGEVQPDHSPDGKRVAFTSDRSGRYDLWIEDGQGGNAIQLTTEGAQPNAPRWSPDGKRIAFAKRPGGNTDIYVVDAQGGVPKRLTTHPANDASAYWSRDGSSIYFGSARTGRQEVWKIPSDGSGPEVQVTKKGGWRSHESMDGKTLYYQKLDLPGLWKMPLAGGEESKVADIPAIAPWFYINDHSYYYVSKRGAGVELHRIDHATSRDSVVRMLPRETARGTSNFSVTPDEKSILFVRTDQSVSDLMLIDNFH